MAPTTKKTNFDLAALARHSFLLLLLIVTALFLYLIQPFLGAVLWACIVGFIFAPLNQRFLRRWPNHKNRAALATLAIAVVIAIIPTLVVLIAFLREGVVLFEKIQNGEIDPAKFLESMQQSLPALQSFVEQFGVEFSELKNQVSNAAAAFGRTLAERAVKLGQVTLQFFVSLSVMVYMAFFMLRDGAALLALLIRALPLGDAREIQLINKAGQMIRATLKGNVVVAVVQGTLGALIFWILGLPGVLFWGVTMAVLSLLPAIGSALIWGPAALYLFSEGHWGKGLVLLVFGSVVIGLADNVLRPLLVGRDTKLPDYLVLLSTLGGLVLFGLNGFVIGPLLAALFVVFWSIFIKEFNSPGRD